jgi:hypothetical protein
VPLDFLKGVILAVARPIPAARGPNGMVHFAVGRSRVHTTPIAMFAPTANRTARGPS